MITDPPPADDDHEIEGKTMLQQRNDRVRRVVEILRGEQIQSMTHDHDLAVHVVIPLRLLFKVLEVDGVGRHREARPFETSMSTVPASDGAIEALTPRQMEVLGLVAEGLSDKAIAAKLFISPHTVSKHVHAILRKLGVGSRTGAATYSSRHRPAQGSSSPPARVS